MLELGNVREGELLYDVGCGDGRLVILAAKELGARAVGIEIREDLFEKASSEIRRLNLEGRVKLIRSNFFDVDLSQANVVTMYLTSSANEKLRPKLESELKSGTRVVSHDFKVANWKPLRVYNELLGHTIYVYRIGQHV
jgi:tRNA A58 N-methylase Trm61